MARRTPETLADYIVVGIAPALIIALIASLVFFLIGVFYQGEFPYRLTWVMGLFVLATVCVARISMEEGAGYAALFGLPLGVVVGIAVVYFVQIEGPLAPFSPLINWGLLALIWWCAHQLTWDCTLIDNRRDTTGQGLLQSMGWDDPLATDNGAADAASAPAASAVDASAVEKPARPAWWRRLFQHEDQPAAHGRWVVYFSVAALPLFGLGQFFIPVADTAGRRFAFWMLVIYVGSALGLLLTTSFLGLRRYIRQRQLEMPVEMAAAWLGVGVAMILGLLAAAALLPRPAPEYSVADAVQQRIGRFTSPDRSASRMGFGSEGTESENIEGSAAGKTSGEDSSENGSAERSGENQGQSGSGGEPNASGKSERQGGDSSNGATGESDKSGGGGNGKTGSASGKQESGSSGSESGEKQESSRADADNRQPTSQTDDGQPMQRSDSAGSERAATSQGSRPTQSAAQSQASEPSPARSPPILQQAMSNLGNLLRYAFYAALAIVAAILAWKYRRELQAAWQQLLKELSELWARWFGGEKKDVSSPQDVSVAAPQKTFRDFPNPFVSGQATRMTPPQLVQYSFEALQAWGREFAIAREEGQTPHEFSESLAAYQPTIDVPARQLSEIYSRLAYARQAPPPQTAAILQTLWRAMSEVAHRPVNGDTAGRPVGSA